jgi:hypothetical protein
MLRPNRSHRFGELVSLPPAWIVLVAGLFALTVSGGASAQGLAYAVFNGPYEDAELHRLSLETGDLTRVGAVGQAVTHIAFDSEGRLHGVASGSDLLLGIDVLGGSGTPIGSLGVDIHDVAGLTFDDGGRLWMTARDVALGPSLYEIDRLTGAALWIAGIAEEHFGSLASSGGTVFMASDSLAVVETSTGSVHPLPSSDFGIWWSRALDFDGSGRLWSLMLCGPCFPPFDVLAMMIIDHTTGTIMSDGPAEPHGTWGLAIFGDGLFLDGFESGDATAWSAVVGAGDRARCPS